MNAISIVKPLTLAAFALASCLSVGAAAETLYSADLPGRKQLVVEGVLEKATVSVSFNEESAETRNILAAVTKAKVTGTTGVLGQTEIARFPTGGDLRPFADIRVVEVLSVSHYTILATIVADIPQITIFDHSSVPMVVRRGEYPPELKVRDFAPAVGELTWKPEQPNQVQLAFVSGDKTISKTFSLLTGEILGP